MWSVRLPLLFIVSPRYLHLGTSCNVSPFSFSVLFFPWPLLITLHFAAPRWMWYFFALWFVTSSIPCSLFRSWCIRHTSSIQSSECRVKCASILYPRFFSLGSFEISSTRVAYSMTDSTPPCLMLSLMLILLVRPYLVCILAVRFELSLFLIILTFSLILRF